MTQGENQSHDDKNDVWVEMILQFLNGIGSRGQFFDEGIPENESDDKVAVVAQICDD